VRGRGVESAEGTLFCNGEVLLLHKKPSGHAFERPVPVFPESLYNLYITSLISTIFFMGFSTTIKL